MARDPAEHDAPEPPRLRIAPSVALLVVGASIAVGAVRGYGVPWWTAALALIAVVGVEWLARSREDPRPRVARLARGRRPWPDLGMKAVVEAIDSPCLVVDAAGVVRWVNGPAVAVFRALRPGDPLSFGLRVPALRDAVAAVVDQAAPRVVEWQEKVPTERWLEARLAPMRRPEAGTRPEFVLIRIEDLTERRRVERMRADFVANASHELRTPLAAVTGFIETLQGPARDDATARQRFLAVMAEQAWRMKRLIDDLLSLSRVEMRAHLRPETTVDLAEVVPQVADLVGPAARAAAVEITVLGCDTPAPVRGDRDELVQVFSNLVENAVKYGGSGGRVEIAVSRDGNARLVAVRDFGPGIAPVHIPRLTERFYRAHDETGAKRGTGLGLAIVKHILTRHGGRLDIASRMGEGSTFTVRLDAVDQEKSEEEQSVGPSRN